MPLSRSDQEVLRGLARQVAAIAALPHQQETIALWKGLNGLRPQRPMVMIDQVCWHEMPVGDELTPRVTDPYWRGVEVGLRRTLYQWQHMRVDMVVEPVLDVPLAIRNTGFGIQVQEQRAVLDPRNDVVGHLYLDQMKTEADVERIQVPEISLDEAATAQREEEAHQLLDGILDIRLQGAFPSFAPWDLIAMWRGVNALLYDLADRPGFLHLIMERLTAAMLAMLDQYESLGLLGRGQRTIHCTGAHTDELPAPGFAPQRPRARDLWTCGMAQIFSTVSPATHQELELAYANRWYERFGLVYYGCCEPLDDKIAIIRDIPHCRKISMSPWVDVERGASRIGRDFVFSRKPSPAFLAVDDWSAAAVEEDLRQVKERCQAHGCPLEFILKDISTVRYEPQRLWEWAEVAMRVAES
ncbi:MAG: hypothetical protein ABIL09_26500 [Gemmatimonadota bacterium]